MGASVETVRLLVGRRMDDPHGLGMGNARRFCSMLVCRPSDGF